VVTPDLLQDLMTKAHGRCAYAEARHVHVREDHASVLNGHVEEATAGESEGIGVRVRVGGGWGFAATRDVSAAGAEDALARALAIAQAQPTAAATPLASAGDPAGGHWEGPCEQDPFAVSLDDRLAHLFAAEELMRSIGDERVVRSWAGCTAIRTSKAFASTEGAACTQVLTECGGGIQAVAVGDGELQVRSYPSSHGGHVAAAGWEHLLALDLAAHAPRVAEEAVALLTAPVCPEHVTALVVHSEQVALQVHESIGHALELDRILLGEASYAGTSFVGAADLGSLRYGSELLNVTADATSSGGLGSFGWDDEGVPARRTPLIENGILRAALSNRESAATIGLAESGGCARANGFARQPIVRMTNVNLEPGDAGSLEDLIAATDSGLYVENNRSWSIDDRRLQFQFACELGREIHGGELGRLLRNPSYAGITPRFWGSLDAVCSPSEWTLWGLMNCGKGEPGQVMHVSHGAAPARFAGVQVGVA
jgi:TldD protein